MTQPIHTPLIPYERLGALSCKEKDNRFIALFSDRDDPWYSVLVFDRDDRHYKMAVWRDDPKNAESIILAKEDGSPFSPPINGKFGRTYSSDAFHKYEEFQPILAERVVKNRGITFPSLVPDTMEDNDGIASDWQKMEQCTDPKTDTTVVIDYSSLRHAFRVAVTQDETTLCKKFQSAIGQRPYFGMGMADEGHAYDVAEKLAQLIESGTKPPIP